MQHIPEPRIYQRYQTYHCLTNPSQRSVPILHLLVLVALPTQVTPRTCNTHVLLTNWAYNDPASAS
ncbi:hypothetical protein COCC4DRAFT_30066 [Bipolaris maydis ATCC 48331]|uniref:Uncharacterized protein n=1 Tax=Cochliobolus heterostrophus (strain C4 / ATCC 48331 / race T) TaxID=665024 RepID=N4XS62_COCH4|nr:uncharacterized protein COCC4DRAFT_30066 [Bipolaris maydis ATCC 48331]ENI09191.1 hypothetical protein COCC4DRAFT_30066 [Bipolaris maydis ATCC 48331]